MFEKKLFNIKQEKDKMGKNIVNMIDNMVTIKHALISVSDKHNIEKLISGLLKMNMNLKIYSTGGTYNILKLIVPKNNIIEISDYTGQPEMQGGLVKTLDYKIYLSLLSETYNKWHQSDIKRLKATPIDLVVCNLYPFGKTFENEGWFNEKTRADIDIGGPCMIRASAKNYLRTTVISSVRQYDSLLKNLNIYKGCLPLKYRYECAQTAFKMIAKYDTIISRAINETKYERIKKAYSIVKK